MTRATDSAQSPALPSESAVSVDGHVCPFCGLTREITENFDPATPCPRCTLADTPQTRSATKARVGPWHVRQVRNPWAPGMGFETLLALVKRGQVTRDSIVRGPTTYQLWKRAAEVKGLSREFGVCYSCGNDVDTQAKVCKSCNRVQEPPPNPDVLIEGREMAPTTKPEAPAKAAPPAVPTSAPPTAPVASRNPNPPASMASPTPLPADAFEEAQSFDIGSSTPVMSPDDMLAADEAEMARQLTSRPPVAPPVEPEIPRPPRQIRPRAPGAPRVDDALLTPAELAQAFQLGFTATGANAAAAIGGGNKRGSKLLAAAVIFILIGGSAAALLSLRPEMRSATSQWISTNYTAASGWLKSRTTRTPPPTRPLIASPTVTEETPTTQAARVPLTITPPPAPTPKSVEVSEPPPLVKPIDPVVQTPPAPSAAAPSPTIASPAAPSVTTSAPAPTLAPTPETASAQIPIPPAPAASEPVVQAPPPPPVIPTPAPAPAPVAIAPKPADEMPAGQPDEQARTLWRKAIDAEINQDYVEAVSCYEKIKKLPEDVQPRGLDVRLEQARKLVK